MSCSFCGDTGHKKSNCPNKQSCSFCGELGHKVPTCPDKSSKYVCPCGNYETDSQSSYYQHKDHCNSWLSIACLLNPLRYPRVWFPQVLKRPTANPLIYWHSSQTSYQHTVQWRNVPFSYDSPHMLQLVPMISIPGAEAFSYGLNTSGRSLSGVPQLHSLAMEGDNYFGI